MDLPVDIIYELLYFLDVYDICAFSCTASKNNVFYCEELWKRKCNNVKKENESYMDAYLGTKIPIIWHGDLLRFIWVKENQVFPTSVHCIVLNTKNGAPLQYILPYERVCMYLPGEDGKYYGPKQGVVIDYKHIKTMMDKTQGRALREIVDNETYSSKSKVPIYGYTVDYWRARDGEKEVFCILENVSIIPNVKELRNINRENKIYKLFDGMRLTKIHSLESILRHFISEEEINRMNEEEMRIKIRKELELMHHILPNIIGR
jgi:hypothetical protein